MQLITRLSIVAAVAVLAGCASTSTTQTASAGRHLVYRDGSGNIIRQFDYPDDALCRRVESMAGQSARCQAQPASGLQAKATLRYFPPGMLVEGHYADMARCTTDTAALSPGVTLINPCTAQ
jgi:hypothetical protein